MTSRLSANTQDTLHDVHKVSFTDLYTLRHENAFWRANGNAPWPLRLARGQHQPQPQDSNAPHRGAWKASLRAPRERARCLAPAGSPDETRLVLVRLTELT